MRAVRCACTRVRHSNAVLAHLRTVRACARARFFVFVMRAQVLAGPRARAAHACRRHFRTAQRFCGGSWA
jgi:hypothetical protein